MGENRVALENQYRCVNINMLKKLINDTEQSMIANTYRLPNLKIEEIIQEQKRSLVLMKEGLENNIYND